MSRGMTLVGRRSASQILDSWECRPVLSYNFLTTRLPPEILPFDPQLGNSKGPKGVTMDFDQCRKRGAARRQTDFFSLFVDVFPNTVTFEWKRRRWKLGEGINLGRRT